MIEAPISYLSSYGWDKATRRKAVPKQTQNRNTDTYASVGILSSTIRRRYVACCR